MKKIVRITTVPISLVVLLRGQLRFMKQFFDLICISSPGASLEEIATSESLRIYSVKMTRKITPFTDLMSVYNLYKIFLAEKPEIVHSHTPKAGTVSMLASRLAGVKHRIHTVAGLPLLETTGLKRLLLDTVEKATYACSSQVLVNSEVLRQIMIKNGLATENKLRVLGKGSTSGVDTEHFDIKMVDVDTIQNLKQSLKLNPSDIVFIYMGRYVSDKGVNEMVKAFHQISIRHSQIKLLLLGSRENQLNPLLPETEQIIGENHQIIEKGFIKDVRPYLAISDILILASYREGFPNAVLQAGSMSKPCIVSDINGCNEIIEHGINGLIVPPKDYLGLKKAMERLMDDKELRENMGVKARKMIKESYDQHMVCTELLKFYNSLN